VRRRAGDILLAIPAIADKHRWRFSPCVPYSAYVRFLPHTFAAFALPPLLAPNFLWCTGAAWHFDGSASGLTVNRPRTLSPPPLPRWLCHAGRFAYCRVALPASALRLHSSPTFHAAVAAGRCAVSFNLPRARAQTRACLLRTRSASLHRTPSALACGKQRTLLRHFCAHQHLHNTHHSLCL